MSKNYIIIGILISSMIMIFFSIRDANSAELSRQHVCKTLADDISRLYKRRHALEQVQKGWLNRYDHNDIVVQLHSAIKSWESIDRFCPGHIIDILERADNQLHEHKK